MLFLLNQAVIDVGDPIDTLQTLGVELKDQPNLTRLVELGQDAAFAGRGIENAHEGIRRTLAAMFTLTGQVNCALFLCGERMRARGDVTFRLGLAPITTMAFLHAAQEAGQLTATLINQHVWRVAPGHAAA